MKKKNIGILFSLVAVLALTACGEVAQVETGSGRLVELIEDGNKLVFKSGTGEQILTAQDEVFKSLELEEDYAFSYQDSKILSASLLNLREDSSPGEDQENPIPLSQDGVDLAGYSLLDEYKFSLTDEPNIDSISLYIRADKDESGEIMMDDGQEWILLVHTDQGDFQLFNDHIQLGSLNYYVFLEDDDFYIVAVVNETAGLNIREYKYDASSHTFIPSIRYMRDGNVNLLHAS